MRIPQRKRPLSDFCLDLAIITFSLLLETLFLYMMSHTADSEKVSIFIKALEYTSSPFLFFLFENWVGSNSQGYSRSLNYLFKLSFVGVFFCFWAQNEGGHTGLGGLGLGYIIQWIIVLRYGYVLYRTCNKPT